MLKYFIELLVLIINIFFILHIFIKKKKYLLINKFNLIKKGKYLSTIANCISCHTIYGSKPFSGGVPIKTQFGIIFTPNITSSKLFGIGKLKLKFFKNIIKHGLSKKNEFLYPALPYIYYSKITNSDINSIFLYIKSIPKSNFINRNYKLKFPFNYKKLIFGWRLLFFKNLNKNHKQIFPSLIRGKYITNNLGHCNMCHGKLNNLSGNIKLLNYSGNLFNFNWNIPGLINNKNSLRSLTLNELYKTLNSGLSIKSSSSGPMSEIINNSLQNINKIDILSIANYIKIIFNKNYNKYYKINIKLYNKSKILFKNGKILFKNNCINCHGKFMLGCFPNYPNIKNTLNKFNKKNLTNILYNTNNKNTFKNKFNSFMPNFSLLLKKNQINNIINYTLIMINLKIN